MKKNRPIGVFDSGVGGLTVLDKLIDDFPNEDFIYVADTLNCPYGVKSPEDLRNIVTDVVKYLLSEDVKAIVIACNTATANSHHLSEVTNIPIIGVIEPTAQLAINTTKNKRVAVLATQATVDSKHYDKILEKENIDVFPLACPEFVILAESGELNTEKSYRVVDEKLADLKDKDIDTFVLGCTHFGLLENEIKKAVGEVNIIDSGLPTSNVLREVLLQENLLRDSNNKGKVTINTTKDPEELKEIIPWFKKDYFGINKIHLK